MGFLGGSDSKERVCNAGELGLIPGGEHGNTLQYPCLKNPHGQSSLVGYSPLGCKELAITELLRTASDFILI